MSADVELVRTAFESFAVSRDEIEDYFTRFFTPDGVVEFVDGFPLPGRYEGLDGYYRFFEESYGPYEDVQRRLDAIRTENGTVVALLTVTGRGKGGGTE